MTRRKSKTSNSIIVPNRSIGSDQTADKENQENITEESTIHGIKTIFEDEDKPEPSTSSTTDTISSNAAALYDELDSFRQKWRRELESVRDSNHETSIEISSQATSSKTTTIPREDALQSLHSGNAILKESFLAANSPQDNPKQAYVLAKKLFLIGVSLEQDDMHHESIRYYKQAVHLCPDIEKKIFHEQCEASAKTKVAEDSILSHKDNSHQNDGDKVCEVEKQVPLLNRIQERYHEDLGFKEFTYCKPVHKLKPNTLHISQLPHELILHICRYVVGKELDLASLETLGLVCRGFYLLSRDQSIWRNICQATWGEDILSNSILPSLDTRKDNTDWRQVYLDRPRINHDGIYISRTRYIRQGDTGFQDLTYRPFHVVRYYRYLRFFPDKRVLILTSNEEPERIVPIFRHALDAKQFSSELSILEGTYELLDSNQVLILAEKDFRSVIPNIHSQTRRQAKFHWSRQTPLAQKFNLRFEVKTSESRPFKNNILKWMDYSILTKLETGQEVTSFDLSPDTFPNLQFYRVKRFNLRSTGPLAANH